LDQSLNQKAKNFWIGICVVIGGVLSIGLGLAFIPDYSTISSIIGFIGVVSGGYFAYRNR